MKPSIAIHLQHYLSPSMTFIYRQLVGIKDIFHPIVLCSDKLENTNLFPFGKIFHKQRNFLSIKKSKVVTKLYGAHKLLSLQPVISKSQRKYFRLKLIENRVKLIHAHFGPSGLEILPVAKELNIPLVCTFHGYDASILLKHKAYIENLKGLFTYAHIITVSEVMKRKLVEIGANPKKVSVVRCGIPIDFFKFNERFNLDQKVKGKSVINYLQVSNFVEKKGHAFTIEAFSLLVKKNSNVHLTLAGGGELYNKINQLVKEKNLSNYVTFTGVVNEEKVKDLMDEADVFVHHSVTSERGDKEGVPTVLMEAMATGLPVISTFHSGIPELINDGINGFLVKERNIESYSEKMHEILFVANKFSSNARKKVSEKFNLTKEVSHIVDIYKNLIDFNNKT
ncbi:MAG: hypothetical protein DRQ01_02735 [Ignavibacteriae bacterium]|nr:MAG: hypothetical protein DRQ01_02735 [Ignavibacteriota bacterium]